MAQTDEEMAFLESAGAAAEAEAEEMTDKERLKEIKDVMLFDSTGCYPERRLNKDGAIKFLLDLVERLKLLNETLESNNNAWVLEMMPIHTKIQQLEIVVEKVNKIPFSLIHLMCKNFVYSHDTTEADAEYSLNENIRDTLTDLEKAINEVKP